MNAPAAQNSGACTVIHGMSSPAILSSVGAIPAEGALYDDHLSEGPPPLPLARHIPVAATASDVDASDLKLLWDHVQLPGLPKLPSDQFDLMRPAAGKPAGALLRRSPARSLQSTPANCSALGDAAVANLGSTTQRPQLLCASTPESAASTHPYVIAPHLLPAPLSADSFGYADYPEMGQADKQEVYMPPPSAESLQLPQATLTSVSFPGFLAEGLYPVVPRASLPCEGSISFAGVASAAPAATASALVSAAALTAAAGASAATAAASATVAALASAPALATAAGASGYIVTSGGALSGTEALMGHGYAPLHLQQQPGQQSQQQQQQQQQTTTYTDNFGYAYTANARPPLRAANISAGAPAAAAGERDDSSTDTDASSTDTDEEDHSLQWAKEARRKLAPAPPPVCRVAAARRRGGGGGRGGMSLKLLLDEGILHPGDRVLTVDYKQERTHGDLCDDGRIRCCFGGVKEYFFNSPSAFSIFLKRLVNPTRKADDGWKTIKYNDKFLEHYKVLLAEKRSGPALSARPEPAVAASRVSGQKSNPSDGGPPPKRAKRAPSLAPQPASKPAKGVGVGGRGGGGARTPRLVITGASLGLGSKALGRNGTRAVIGHTIEGQLLQDHLRTHSPAAISPVQQQQQQQQQRQRQDGPKLSGAVEREASNGASPASSGGVAEAVGEEAAVRRPRRDVRPPQRMEQGSMDEHQMMTCEEFRKTPGSGSPGAQPFRVLLAPAAAVAMDFHAHLNLNEVVGLLGGTFDAQRRILTVERACHVAESTADTGSIDVEMDAVDQSRVQEQIREEFGLQVVGWYHSHPTFQALPSIIDIDNQLRQQMAHRSPSGEEPYVAAIIAPWDSSSGAQSQMTWFTVQHPANLSAPDSGGEAVAAGCRPMRLQLEVAPPSRHSSGQLEAMPHSLFPALAGKYAAQPSRAKLLEPWNGGPQDVGLGTAKPQGSVARRLDKLKASVAARLPPEWPPADCTDFLERLEAELAPAWAAALPLKAPKPGKIRV